MTITTNLTKEQRVEILNINKEEILQEMYFINDIREEDSKNEIMTLLVSLVIDENFYSNFLNSFDGVLITDLLERINEDNNHIPVYSAKLQQELEEMYRKTNLGCLPSSMR